MQRLKSSVPVLGKPEFLKSALSWSKLESEQYFVIRDYSRLCVEYYFNKYSPIEAEFIVWELEKRIIR